MLVDSTAVRHNISLLALLAYMLLRRGSFVRRIGEERQNKGKAGAKI